MSRSVWKSYFIPPRLEKKAFKVENGLKMLTVYTRAATIIPQLIGSIVKLHNGRRFVQIAVTDEHVGYKFGEFALTKCKVLHKKKVKVKRK
jgi:small subunit ribosomal protein S19